jgi:cellulose synthase/poly-beta-1,6-N-acetylglucosamine synthase-like glycosyltransferase
VLIPAHNEAASIRETISSLRRQTRPPHEIIGGHCPAEAGQAIRL